MLLKNSVIMMQRIVAMLLFILSYWSLASQCAWATTPMPDPPTLDAGGYVLLDFKSGQPLVQMNATERLEPASLTKIMTAYVVFGELKAGNLHLDDEVPVSEKAWRTGGSRMFIEVGTRVRVEDLLQGMIVQSGNDASVALAEQIAGSEATFAEMMNRQAQRLGMQHSHFTNAPGLPNPDHYSTPHDIAVLTRALIHDFPEYYRWYSQPEYTYNGIRQFNRNRLLRQDASVDGVKTGYTEAAGYCLVASAVRDGQRLISVVMKTPSPAIRTRDSLALLNYGFRFFETHHLYDAHQTIATVRIWNGREKLLTVGPATPVSVTIPRDQYQQLMPRIEKPTHLFAPVQVGDPVGKIIVAFKGEDIEEVPLIALQTVPKGHLMQVMIDTVLRWF
jgi:D-alanyl-D-alanine carboxypeptidase (penicillin-binding protein 5/6)